MLSVGKPRDAALGALHDRYAARLRRLGVGYRARFVAEVRTGGRYSDHEVRRREGRALEALLEERGTVIALDAGGRMLDSRGLAARLARWATPRVSFLIGGPIGLDRGLVSSADGSWSLSALTLPHELARVIVVEQLYRAVTIQRGLPYHK